MKSYKEMTITELVEEIIRVRHILKGDDGKKHSNKFYRDNGKYYQKLCKERNDYYKLKYENGTN